uniref:Uncharacterized protein n=1 Tax=Cyprinus carpio TaxID=7962 RepID=A0A8C1MUS7_CYPCA
MQHHKERRTGDKDKLQRPQTYVGHWEVVVEANVMAARLICVALKVFLFITPYFLRSYDPDTAECGGVIVDPTQEILEKNPIHGPLEIKHKSIQYSGKCLFW